MVGRDYEFNWKDIGDREVSLIEGRDAEKFLKDYRATSTKLNDSLLFELSMKGEDDELIEEYISKRVGSREVDVARIESRIMSAIPEGVVLGSGPLSAALVNYKLRHQGICVAGPSDIEKALSVGALEVDGYFGTALGIGRMPRPNRFYYGSMADLLKKIKRSNFALELRNPLIVPYSELAINFEGNYAVLDLKENPKLFFWSRNGHGKFSEVDDNGMPIPSRRGDRSITFMLDGVLTIGIGDYNGPRRRDFIADKIGYEFNPFTKLVLVRKK